MTSIDPSHFPDLTRKDHSPRGKAVAHSLGGGSSSSHLHIPVIPDLRFEYSYLKSLAPYVKIRRIAAPSADEKHNIDEVDVDVEEEESRTEVVSIDWRKVAWITTRDQVISPLLQGFVWGIASQFVRPVYSFIRSIFRPSWIGRRPSPPAVKKESEFIQRFRNWSKSLTTSGLETNIALTK